MRILLDTHILLWSINSATQLRTGARDLIVSRQNTKLFSTVSIWEVAIKSAQGRPGFAVEPQALLDLARADFIEYAITSEAVIRAAALPPFHRDPFDRLLVAQAMEADALLLTADRALLAYGPPVRLV